MHVSTVFHCHQILVQGYRRPWMTPKEHRRVLLSRLSCGVRCNQQMVERHRNPWVCMPRAASDEIYDVAASAFACTEVLRFRTDIESWMVSNHQALGHPKVLEGHHKGEKCRFYHRDILDVLSAYKNMSKPKTRLTIDFLVHFDFFRFNVPLSRVIRRVRSGCWGRRFHVVIFIVIKTIIPQVLRRWRAHRTWRMRTEISPAMVISQPVFPIMDVHVALYATYIDEKLAAVPWTGERAWLEWLADTLLTRV